MSEGSGVGNADMTQTQSILAKFEAILTAHLETIFQKVAADEIGQTLRPNSMTPDSDILEMRKYYFERISEIVD